jgi:uridine kinase
MTQPSRESVETIAQRIAGDRSFGRMTLIAIEGFGGSGKSTVATRLARLLLGAHVVGIDDFIVKEKLAEPSWDCGTFDRRRLEQEVLKPAVNGRPIVYRKLQWKNNTLSDPVAIPPVPFLIVEGISSYHPDIAHYFDFKIWVQVPMEVARTRGHARDGSGENARYWDLWMSNDLKHQSEYHPDLVADFVIDNGPDVAWSTPADGSPEQPSPKQPGAIR